MEETAAAAAPEPNAATLAPSEPAGAAPDGDASVDPTAVGDDEHDSKEVVLRRYFLQEWELVSAILRRIVAGGGVVEPADVHRIRSIGYSEFYSGLVDSVGSELKGSKDFTKLCAGLSILGYISSQSDGTCTKAFSQLLTFLGHRYPKIRKAAADQVYLVLLQNDDLIPSENIDRTQELLAETCWEGDVEEARRKRSQINEMAGFRVATSLKSENQQKLPCGTLFQLMMKTNLILR